MTATVINNPFAISAKQESAEAAVSGSAIARSDAERAIKEVEAAMAIAKRFPRDPVAAMDRILQACTARHWQRPRSMPTRAVQKWLQDHQSGLQRLLRRTGEIYSSESASYHKQMDHQLLKRSPGT